MQPLSYPPILVILVLAAGCAPRVATEAPIVPVVKEDGTPASETSVLEVRCEEGDLLACPRVCRGGKAYACTKLGKAGIEGPGANPRETARWLRRGCDLGDAEACHWLASFASMIPEVGMDSSEITPLLKQACEANHGAACSSLGLEVESRGDPEGAARWFDRGCRLGESRACFNLGVMHHHGTGGPMNLERAATLYEQACNGGELVACSDFAVMLREGQGMDVDDERAVKLFTQACDGGLLAACFNLGLHCEEGRGVAKSMSRAAELYERACNQGEARGCNNLGLLYERGLGVFRDKSRAAALYEKACENGIVSSCVNLGFLLDSGDGVPRDRKRARQLYEQACQAGMVEVCEP